MKELQVKELFFSWIGFKPTSYGIGFSLNTVKTPIFLINPKYREFTVAYTLFLRYVGIIGGPPRTTISLHTQPILMLAVTYKVGKTVVSMPLSESQHKAWRKYKRTLAIKEPCKESKIIAFAAYLKNILVNVFYQ